jgi:hypothetical protein
MRWSWILLSFSLACTRPPAPEEAATPPAIERMMRDLGEAGIATEAQRLRSLREFPGCEDAQFRYRLHFRGGFVNVSRFDAPQQASACLADFRRTVTKAGEAAWEQMRDDITTHGPWLFFFPPDFANETLRAEILTVLRSANGD